MDIKATFRRININETYQENFIKPHDCIFRNFGNLNLPEVKLISDKQLYYCVNYSIPSLEKDFISYAIDHEFSQAVQDRLKILTEKERALLARDMIYAKERRNQTPFFCFENSTTKYDQSLFFVINPTKYSGNKISHKDKVGDLFQEIYRLVERRISNTIKDAKEKWPELLNELPMHDSQKEKLREYWKSLKPDFRIDA